MTDWTSLGLYLRESEKKNWDRASYECRKELRFLDDHCLVAAFLTTTRAGDGNPSLGTHEKKKSDEQILSTHTDFIQYHRLTIGQIRAINHWLRELTIAAAWRLTTYTIMVGAAE